VRGTLLGKGDGMLNKQRHVTGLVTVNVAVVLFGLAGVLGKLSHLPSPLITFGRVAIAGLALISVTALRRVAVRPRSRSDAVVLVAQGFVLAAHWTMFFQSIAVSSVAIGLLSFSSFPLFTVALEALLLRQHISRVQLAAALLIIPGVSLLVPSFHLGSGTTAGVLWGVGAGASFALLSVTNRQLTLRYPSIIISLYQDVVAALVLAPTLVLVPHNALFTLRTLVLFLLLGLCCTALAHTLFIVGLRTTTAQLASLLASLEPIWGIIFGMVVLGELPTVRTYVGGAIILVATLLPAVFALVRLHSTDE